MNNITCIVPSKYDDIFKIFIEHFKPQIKSPLIIIDDGLSEDVKQQHPDVAFIPAPQPFALVKSANIGFAAAGDNDVLFFNDDVIIMTNDFDQRIQEIAYKDSQIGIVGPIATNVQNPDQAPDNVIPDKEYVETNNPITSVCWFIKRSILNEVGYLDLAYSAPGDWGRDDVDYCKEVKKAGYKLVVAYNCQIQHGGEKFGRAISNTAWRAGLSPTGKHTAYFDQKWGDKSA